MQWSNYFVLFTLLFAGISSTQAEPITIVCSTDNAKDSLHVAALEKFGELVREYSDGRVVAEIHYRGSKKFPAILGEEANVNMVMAGRGGVHKTIHVTVVAAGNAARKVGILNFLMLPYLFPDIQAAKRVFQSDYIQQDLNSIITKKHQVRVLGWLIGGFRHLTNSKKPVTRLEDITNLVIRTPRNRLMMDTYSAFGATVDALNWKDTFQALQEGRVDGQENPYNVILYSKFWEAKQKYITTNGPFLWVGPILINEEFYQALLPGLQKAVKQAGLDASYYEWDWIAEKNNTFKQALLNNGMQISDLEDKQKWIDATRHLWNNYYKHIGYGDSAVGKKVVDTILEFSSSQ